MKFVYVKLFFAAVSLISATSFAESGTKGGGDALVCRNSGYFGKDELADVAIRVIYPFSFSKLDLGTTSSDEFLIRIQTYMEKYLPSEAQEVSAAFLRLNFVLSKKKLPPLETGYAPSPSGHCKKELLAYQHLKTGLVEIYQPIYEKLNQLEDALLKIHEAYVNIGYQKLGHEPNWDEFVNIETIAREHVRNLTLNDPKEFLNILGIPFPDLATWTTIDFTCTNLYGKNSNINGPVPSDAVNMVAHMRRTKEGLINNNIPSGVGFIQLKNQHGDLIFSIGSPNKENGATLYFHPASEAGPGRFGGYGQLGFAEEDKQYVDERVAVVDLPIKVSNPAAFDWDAYPTKWSILPRLNRDYKGFGVQGKHSGTGLPLDFGYGAGKFSDCQIMVK